MIALAVVSSVVAICLTLIVINLQTNLNAERRAIGDAEVSIRQHLQAQVDDLHAKLLAHDWQEYGSTVQQRSALDRAIEAEARLNHDLGSDSQFQSRINELFEDQYDPMEGPTVG